MPWLELLTPKLQVWIQAGGSISAMNALPHAGLRQVISADQIQKRVRELGRQISDDYRGQTVIALGILENSFLFMADLVRTVDVPYWRFFLARSCRLPASMCCWSRVWCTRA